MKSALQYLLLVTSLRKHLQRMHVKYEMITVVVVVVAVVKCWKVVGVLAVTVVWTVAAFAKLPYWKENKATSGEPRDRDQRYYLQLVPVLEQEHLLQ